MKRREFLKRTGQAALLAAVPVALLASTRTDVTATSLRPEQSVEEWIRAALKKQLSEQMDRAAFEQMYTGTKLMTGEIGHYEGVRFIEQTHVPAGVPKRTHSYLDLAGNKWAWS